MSFSIDLKRDKKSLEKKNGGYRAEDFIPMTFNTTKDNNALIGSDVP